MKRANRHSKVGDKVTVEHPRTHAMVSGVVDWISPTRGTIQVKLPSGLLAYEYPEFDGTYPPQTPRQPWKRVAGMTEGFEVTIAKGKASA